jgi:hypothetical protein
LATDDHLSITFLEDRTVNRLSRDSTADSPVRIDELMVLDVSQYDQLEEVYVMDGMVAVMVNSTEFEFFLMPLVTSQTVKPLSRAALTSTQSLAGPFDYSRLIDYGFAPNKRQTTYTLFGLRKYELVKIEFTLGETTMKISEKVTIEPVLNLDSSFMRLVVTDEFVIVSNSDSDIPAITFFDHDLNEIKSFSILA